MAFTWGMMTAARFTSYADLWAKPCLNSAGAVRRFVLLSITASKKEITALRYTGAALGTFNVRLAMKIASNAKLKVTQAIKLIPPSNARVALYITSSP